MKRLCLLLSLLVCLSFLVVNTNAYSDDNISVNTTITETNDGGMRLVYQVLPVDAKCKIDTTTFYKGLNLKIRLRGEDDCEFDTANMFGLEFFKINDNKISFGGIYMDQLTASVDGNEFNASSFLVGFGVGYATNKSGPVRFEITPYGQIGMGRYVVSFDEEYMDDEESDWGLCWQGGIKGNLVFALDVFEIGINAGYIYYSQKYVVNTRTVDIDEVAEFDVNGSGMTYGATAGFRF